MNGLTPCFDGQTGCENDASPDVRIEYKIAATQWEREGAFRLLYQAYENAGFIKYSPQQMRVTPHHLLPTTNVMIARYASQVISTVSMVEDGQWGLPMEQVFSAQVRERRQRGLVLAEVCCMADRRKNIKRYFPVFVQLCRLMSQYALNRGVDQFLIAVHPRHVRFYTQYLAYEQITDVQPYPAVRNHLAVVLCLDLKRLEIERPANYERFFADPIAPECLQSQPMSESEQSYFRGFVDDSSLRDVLTASDRSGPTGELPHSGHVDPNVGNPV